MKKLLSALFSLFIIFALAVAAYFNQEFLHQQYNKARGMYYVYRGDKEYQKSKMQQAIKFYNQGLSIYPEHYGAWYNLGNIYVEYEDYYSAIFAYAQAFGYNPRMMVARMNYGIIVSEKLGDFDAAIDQYDKIIDTERNIISIPYVYSNKLSFKANKAIAYYNKGVAYRLKSLYCHDDWELQRKYLALAVQAYKKSIEIEPNNYDSQYNLGLVYHLSGNYNNAGKCYCKAIKANPMNYEAHYNLAILLRKLGHYQEAYDEIDKASTLVTALAENSATQQYAAIVMNDLTRSVFNSNRQDYLQKILEEEKQETQKHIEKKDSITSTGIEFIDGKIVATEKLDKAILENFGQCPSLGIFTGER